MLEALREGAQNGAVQFKGSGKNQIQMQMLQEMMAIDRERAMTTTRAWAKFVQLAAGRQNDTTFANLEEYIPYRMLDIGEMWAAPLLCLSQILLKCL
jgi:fusicocca-2,10(14)-diene synthase/ophiobolin F synthase